MWELLLECLWIVWSFLKLITIAAYSLFQDLYREHKSPAALPPQHGRVAIVTGGSSGIGFHVTKTLCELGMHVIIASSSKKNIEASIKSIKKQVPDAVLEGFEVDLGSIKSVHKFAHQFKSRRLPLHILINNAGVMHIPYKKTVDGIEKQIAVNFMGHFLLTILLLPVLNVSGTNQLFARVVNVSSSTHRVGSIDLTTFTSKGAKPSRYSPYAAYAQSKLAMIMGTYELSRRLKAAKCFRVTVNCLHPGVVDTNLHTKAIFPGPLFRRCIGRFYKSPAQGADTVLYVALSPDLEKQSGGYYENCEKVVSSKKSQSFQVQQAIWHTTCSVLNIDPHDLPSSRSHELMSNSGLAFSWHDDYVNSPYQTNVGSPDKKPEGFSPVIGRGEEMKIPSDNCVIDFDKDGEPSPQDGFRSSLEKAESTKHKDLVLMPPKKSDLNANTRSEKEETQLVQKRPDSFINESIVVHQSGEVNINNMKMVSARGMDPENGNFLCQEFMSTPTIRISPAKEKTGKLRAVMCGNDIIYIQDEEEEYSRPSSAPISGRSTPGTSGSYISMEEGELINSLNSSQRASSGNLPCIHLNESMLESLQCDAEPVNETSDFTYIDEINPKIFSSKCASLQNSPLRSQTPGTSQATSCTHPKSAPASADVSPVISKKEKQFDTLDPNMPNEDSTDEIMNDTLQYISQAIKLNSPDFTDSNDEILDESQIPSILDMSQKRRRQSSPSISGDEEEDLKPERGRTMVRRCSRIRIPASEDVEEYDDINIGLPYPGLASITITPNHSSNTCSSDNSPEKITPYQDNVILDFVNGVITESMKIVQKSKSPVSEVENPPKDENCTEVGASVSREAAIATELIDSVDEEIRVFMKEGTEKFQDSQNFIPPSNTSVQEQKSNAFAQKGWDRLPQDVSDAELKAFAEHTILYNEMMRSGRVTPVKIQLDTVREESDINSNNKSPEIQPTGPPKTLPKPKSSAMQKVQSPENSPQGMPNSTCSQQQSPKHEFLSQNFERMLDLEKSPPGCPQNTPRSNSSDSDATLVNSVNDLLQETSQGLEDGSSDEARPGEPGKSESISSGEERPDEPENQFLPPGIGMSQIFFSPHVSPAKRRNSKDMTFMFQLQSDNYQKASIIELNDNEKSEADDVLQGVPLLDEIDSDDDEQLQGSYNLTEKFIFEFQAKMDESPSRFKESIDTETDNQDSTTISSTSKKSSEPPPVAKKPVRPAQDTSAPKRSPATSKKPVRPQHAPPPVPKKPGKSDPSPEKTITEPKTAMSPSESTAEDIAVGTVKNTESPGKSTVSSEIKSVTPEKLSEEKDRGSPMQWLPGFGKLMQELSSLETSDQNLSPVSQVKYAGKETVNPLKESVSPVRHAASPVKKSVSPVRHAASPVKESVSPVGHAASPMKQSVSPVRHAASPVKESVSPVRHAASPMKQSVSPVRHAASPMKESVSPVRHAASPVKESVSPVRHAASPVKESVSPVRHAASPMKESVSPVRHAASPMKESVSPVRHAASPMKESVSPVRHAASPMKESVSPVRHAASPVEISISPANELATLAASPVKELVNLMEQASSPVKAPGSPLRQTASSVGLVTTTVKELISLADQTASPGKGPDVEVESPVKEAVSPVKQASNHLKERVSSVEQASSPVKKLVSLMEQATSPVEQQVSPVRQVASPVRQVSPMKQAASPAKQVGPVMQVASPAKQVSPVRQVDSPVIQVSPVRQVDSPVIQVSPVRQVDSPVIQVSPVRQVDSPVIQVSPVKQVDSPVIQVSPVRQVDSPVIQVSPVKQVDSPVIQVSPVRQVTSPVKQVSPLRQVAIPEKQPLNPARTSNMSLEQGSVSSMESTAGSDSPKKATEQPEKKSESPKKLPGTSAGDSEEEVSTSDLHLTSTDSAEKDVQLESPPGKILEGQTCPQPPAHRAVERIGQEKKRVSIDSTDQTDVSESSNFSLYTMAESSFDSEDCFFDSHPEIESLLEDSDYAQIMAGPDPASNSTQHSEPLSFSPSETKSEDAGNNPKDSHSSC